MMESHQRERDPWGLWKPIQSAVSPRRHRARKITAGLEGLRMHRAFRLPSQTSEPILPFQLRDPFELPHVVGDQSCRQAPGVCGDQKVHASDGGCLFASVGDGCLHNVSRQHRRRKGPGKDLGIRPEPGGCAPACCCWTCRNAAPLR